jgi:hypothetical protein
MGDAMMDLDRTEQMKPQRLDLPTILALATGVLVLVMQVAETKDRLGLQACLGIVVLMIVVAAVRACTAKKTERSPLPDQPPKQTFEYSTWKRVAAAGAAIIAIVVWGIVYFGTSTPCKLQSLRLYVRHDRDDARTFYWDLLNPEQSGAVDQTIRAGVDDIMLTGTFNVPVHWFILWHDTNGQLVLAGKGKDVLEHMKYPEKGIVTPNPTDPSGTHFIWLIAETGNSPIVTTFSEPVLSKHPIGKPPNIQDSFVSESIRGPQMSQEGANGRQIATDADLKIYLQRVRNWLSTEFEVIQVVGFNVDSGH